MDQMGGAGKRHGSRLSDSVVRQIQLAKMPQVGRGGEVTSPAIADALPVKLETERGHVCQPGALGDLIGTSCSEGVIGDIQYPQAPSVGMADNLAYLRGTNLTPQQHQLM